jgi:predicted transcriptional regulator
VLSDRQWINLNQVAHKTNLNQQRLPKIFDSFDKRGFVKKWETLNEEQKIEEKRRQVNIENGMYKITELGFEKFRKIKDDCLDEYTKEILRLQVP